MADYNSLFNFGQQLPLTLPYAQPNLNLPPGIDAPLQQPAGGFNFTQLLADPNMQQLLAGIGARIGGQGSVGEAIGVPTGQAIRAQQFQKAATKQQGQQQDLWQSILGAIQGGDTGKLFTEPGTPGLDSMTIDSKGINIKAPNVFGASGYGTDEPLEAGTEAKGGGRDFSPFFKPLLG